LNTLQQPHAHYSDFVRVERRTRRRRRGMRLGWIGVLLLAEACIEQFFPGDSFVKGHSFFLLKDVLQSLVAVYLAYRAVRLASMGWLSLLTVALLNAVLTLSAGMSLGPDDFIRFVQQLYPQQSSFQIHIRRTRT
jgi:hypothetical protein